MSKPRLKGPTIGVRLPLAHHEALLVRAAKTDETPGAYISRMLTKSLDADVKAAQK